MTATELLVALQLADSAFPSGSFVASWGLEVLVDDGTVVTPADVTAFAEGQLRWRWATCDRVVLVRAHDAAPDLDVLMQLDDEVEAITLPALARSVSTRIGGALVAVDAASGGSVTADYLDRIDAGAARGHLAVAQGLLGWSRGLDVTTTSAVSGYQLLAGLTSAAVRLGVIGHLDAQRTLHELRPALAELVVAEVPDRLASSAFEADRAMLRHETLPNRLFAC